MELFFLEGFVLIKPSAVITEFSKEQAEHRVHSIFYGKKKNMFLRAAAKFNSENTVKARNKLKMVSN